MAKKKNNLIIFVNILRRIRNIFTMPTCENILFFMSLNLNFFLECGVSKNIRRLPF